VQNEGFYYDTREKLRKTLQLSETDICQALEFSARKALAPP
jgi:hypothetical protein